MKILRFSFVATAPLSARKTASSTGKAAAGKSGLPAESASLVAGTSAALAPAAPADPATLGYTWADAPGTPSLYDALLTVARGQEVEERLEG